MKHKKIVLLLFLPFLFSACSNRNLVYFSDLPKKSQYVSNTLQVPEPVIQAGDILSIKVNSMSAESNAIFNSGGISTAADRSETGYLVDKAGEISFPIVGKIKLAGLTTQQAREKMTKEVLRYVKDPIVNLKLLNFKVTVIGEVARPSTFTIQNEEINLLEALGMAGDMTAFGKRENVLVIRENDNRRVMARVNLNNKDVLNSPYFYLQPNDIVYVEPVPARAAQASNNNRYISIIVGLTSVATLVISRLL